MRREELEFDLPEELIAQEPIEPRDAARLLVVDRSSGGIEHRAFRELPLLLRPGDLLVVNDSRVLPARLRGTKCGTAGEVEILLLRELEPDGWEALMRPGRRLRPGVEIVVGNLLARCVERLGDGHWRVHFSPPGGLRAALEHLGEMPLPPYIHTKLRDPERYQTVYARNAGSAAAPTAGLHFTPRLLEELERCGIQRAPVTLHVGVDTFRPVQTAIVEEHPMHSEAYVVPPATAAAVHDTRARGGRVVAVGTTSVRALESAVRGGVVAAGGGWTRLFITPGYRFHAVDALLTNFHLPRTTLYALVCAFAGAELIRRAYQEAFAERYRLLSFGDAMLLL